MNLLQLVIKQMRQRALATWLTLLSVLLGVALAVSILLLRRGGQALFGQTEFGFDVIAGVKSSPLQLVMNTIYHIDQSPGNLPYWVYEQLNNQERPPRGSKEFDYHAQVKLAVPMAVGDSYKGRPIIGAPPKLFVSLAGLKQQAADLADRQRAARNAAGAFDAKSNPPAAEIEKQAADQQAIIAELSSLKTEIDKIGARVIPIVEQGDALANAKAADAAASAPDAATTAPTTAPASPQPASGGELMAAAPKEPAGQKWKYGYPSTLRCDAANDLMRQAADAINAKDFTTAADKQKDAAKLLDTITAAISANSGALEYRPEKTYEIADGRVYHAWKLEAVIGSEVAEKTGLKLNDHFQATHGMPGPNDVPDIHKESWEIVGIMKPTHTAADRCLYIPLISFYCIAEHEQGLEAHDAVRLGQAAPSQKQPDADDEPKWKAAFGEELCPGLPHTKDFINLDVTPDKWEVSAVAIKTRGDFAARTLIYHLKNGGIPNVVGVNPAETMRQFFDTFLTTSAQVLLLIALLVSVVAGIGILVSIYNSVTARYREIAILRALGATRAKVLAIICVEAVLIGIVGAVVGLLVGHLLGAGASSVMMRRVGEGFDWVSVGRDELGFLGLVVLIALFAGLVPALKAYKTPVATNLVGG